MIEFTGFVFKMSVAATSLFLLLGCRKDDNRIPAAKQESPRQDNPTTIEKQVLNTDQKMGAEAKAVPPSGEAQKDLAIAFKPENFLHKSDDGVEIKNTDPDN